MFITFEKESAKHRGIFATFPPETIKHRGMFGTFPPGTIKHRGMFGKKRWYNSQTEGSVYYLCPNF